MRIIMTGGTGLLGQPLAEELAANGHEVVILSRHPAKYRDMFSGGITVAGWDVTPDGDWIGLVDGADAVVNFAGENLAGDGYLPERWTAKKKRRIGDSRVQAGRAIVGAIERAAKKPPVLLQASAIGYYGPRGNEPLAEDAPPGTDYLAQVCVEWESTTEAVEAMGVRRVIARTGLVQTPDGGPLRRLLLPYKLFAGVYFGDGKHYWSWIHLQDAVRAYRFLLENEAAAGPFNITAPNPLTCRAYGQALGRAMNRPSYLPVPGFALRLVLGEVATIVVDGQRVVPVKLQELGFDYRFADAEAAFRDLLKS